ncbi:MAG: excinuclease ABC subunit UvrC [Thiotrichaceae bacterium]
MSSSNTPSPDNNAFDSASFLKTVPHKPGVYQMMDSKDQVLYVGKAKDLKSRVSSYFRGTIVNSRIWSMVKQICNVQIILTATEAEALLLESNLIKKYHPRYNVLLRDDKSYPYIHISTDQDFPRVTFYRGGRKHKGEYFGPYPSAGAVRESLGLLQKLFKVRQCEDSYYGNRSRPCLQYQIERCTAPCTGEIGKQAYRQNVSQTIKFLKGKSQQVIDELVINMDVHAENLEFEEAAGVRDQIEYLRHISQQQAISGGQGDVDVIAIRFASKTASVQVHSIRNGNHLGNKNFFPKVPETVDDEAEILASFMAQYYLKRQIPSEVIVTIRPDNEAVLTEMLATTAERKVTITHKVRGDRAKWVEMAIRNAQHALNIHLASKEGIEKRLYALQEELGLDYIPTRIECFDISHTQGEATVASCVVFGTEGAIKAEYRRFNITDIQPGDDYAAMRQVLRRRFKKIVETDAKLPDVLLIDGGKGQVTQAINILQELQISSVDIMGVVKGEGRRAEFDNLIIDNRRVVLSPFSSAMHLVQQIRDEAHRFAITGHRQRRQKARTSSVLEEITGLGPKRRQNLLKQFGGIRAISRASVDELAKVHGISQQLAEKVYEQFNRE